MRAVRSLIVSFAALALCGLAVEARAENVSPDQVRVDEHLGASVPLDLAFSDASGRQVLLGELVRARPTILVLYYDHCPMLCGLVLNGLVESLRKLDKRLGNDFQALTVSIDPHERATDAARKRSLLLERLGAPSSAAWPFVVGSEPSIEALARAVGFVYAKVPGTQDFAHPAVIVVLTPDGKVSRYLYGISFPERDLRLALVEAGEGRFGSSFERFLLKCYRFDPASHRYELAVRGVFRLGGAIVLIGFGLFLARLWRRDGRRA